MNMFLLFLAVAWIGGCIYFGAAIYYPKLKSDPFNQHPARDAFLLTLALGITIPLIGAAGMPRR
jgi:hypothetical protein